MINRHLNILKALLMIFVIIIMDVELNAQKLYKIRLIDSRTKNSVPFAYIKIIGKNLLEISNEDGYFSLPELADDSIQISHVSYNTILTTFDRIKTKEKIEMKELAIELNPIVINTKSAETIVEKAIDSTYISLFEPMNFTCFRKDQVFFRDNFIAEAKAEISYVCKYFFKPSNGGVIIGFLKNIIVEKSSSFNDFLIPPYYIPSNYAPINSFIVGVSEKVEKYIFYSKQEINDSIIIINVNPRLDFKPIRNHFIKYGRFIINKKTWKIIRIDTYVSPEMLLYSRTEHLRPKDATRYIYHFSYSHFYNQKGILSKVLLDIKYSYLENNTSNIWQNKSELVFIPTKVPDDYKSMIPLKRDTSLVQMQSKFSKDFKMEFNKWIPE